MKIPATYKDKKLTENVMDDEPGKEMETEYDKSLNGPMGKRMQPRKFMDEECNYGLTDSDGGSY